MTSPLTVLVLPSRAFTEVTPRHHNYQSLHASSLIIIYPIYPYDRDSYLRNWFKDTRDERVFRTRQRREAKICLQYDISIFERYLILVVGRLLVECNYLHFSFYKSLLKVNQALIPQSCRFYFCNNEIFEFLFNQQYYINNNNFLAILLKYLL